MKFGDYKKSFSSLQLENSFHRLLALGLVIIIGILLVALINKKTIVTIQPWTLARDAQVTETEASQSYYEAWGLALAELVGNVQPGSVEFVGNQLKPLLSPKIYHETIDALQAGADRMRDDRVSMRFEPIRVIYEKSTGITFVYGQSFTRTGTGVDKEAKTMRTYEFKLRIANYVPQIDFINTYEGVPHTRDEMDRIERREVRDKMRDRKEAVIQKETAIDNSAEIKKKEQL